ncbi:hypothetical protein HMPREF1985_00735 [Mitsuokella sp. oral taxon 131 str. W9106]|nr:hypothetical protein HMPREF1985_00735 [Mitsuokella sp. oral taxon 131 str. W9106]
MFRPNEVENRTQRGAVEDFPPKCGEKMRQDGVANVSALPQMKRWRY